MAPPPTLRSSSFAQVAMALAAESQSITSFEVSDHKNRMILNADGSTRPMEQQRQQSQQQQQQQGPNATAPAESPREARAAFILRVAIIGILVAAAVLYSVKVYFYTRDREQADFQIQFSNYADKVINSIQISMEQSLLAADLMAVTFTSYALDRNLTWPYVTLPDFAARAARANRLIGEGAALGFAPMVADAQRQGWETYSVANQASVMKAIAYEQSNPQLFSGGGVSVHMTQNAMITPYIWSIGLGNLTEKDNSTGRAFPIWQSTSLSNPLVVINYNELSNPVFADDVTIASGGQVATVSNFFTSFLQESAGSVRTALFYPVFQDLEESTTRSVVGLLNVMFSWEKMLKGILPNNANTITAVLSSNCGPAYTFNIKGENVLFEGQGDLHDTSFNSMEESIRLSSILIPGLLQVEDLGCHQSLLVYPTEAFRNDFFTNRPIIYTAILTSTLLLVVGLFVVFDWLLKRRHQVLHREAVKSNAIVTSMFPSQVRDRLGRRFSYRITQAAQPPSERPARKVRRLSVHFQTPKNKLRSFLKTTESAKSTPELFGTAPIADLFPNATVFFADIAGFTAWSSEREPTQVFILLETIYCAFDALAKRCGVFKVETIGDCYMAVTGVPDPQENHATVMTVFAKACLKKMQQLTKQLEATLGPGTADLAIRVGLHSGPITAGVLRGENSRFQLFGDTVNTASRMESNGRRNGIHMSEETAQLLINAGKGHWVVPREDRIVAKGKGELKTFWLVDREAKQETDNVAGTTSDDCGDELDTNEPSDEEQGMVCERLSHQNSGIWAEARWDENQAALLMMDRNKLSRLINWNVDVLLGCLKEIIANRQEYSTFLVKPLHHRDSGRELHTLNPRDEVTEFIVSPNFDPSCAVRRKNPATIEISPKVISQLRKFVSYIASLYRNNPFHNFEHASHVAMSSNKLLQRIISPDIVDDQGGDVSKEQRKIALASDLHDRTCGISTDPLTQFAVVFSALIHDVDHTGFTNTHLVLQNNPLALKYRNQSVAEQNSIVLAWDLLMSDDFIDLRRCIYSNESETKRFRQLVVNSVIATDLFDKDLQEFRENRWQKAFTDKGEAPWDGCSAPEGSKGECLYRKATAVIEHIIQASDVAHTMQHWQIYQKWNEKLFEELSVAFRKGRSSDDPALTWYQNELDFFDNYVIPLAQKLKECGVFGVSGDEYLNYALQNRKEWELTGKEVVAQMVSRFPHGDEKIAFPRGNETSATQGNQDMALAADGITAGAAVVQECCATQGNQDMELSTDSTTAGAAAVQECSVKND